MIKDDERAIYLLERIVHAVFRNIRSPVYLFGPKPQKKTSKKAYDARVKKWYKEIIVWAQSDNFILDAYEEFYGYSRVKMREAIINNCIEKLILFESI